MMKPYDSPEIKHVGRFPHRLADNPREAAFLKAWQEQQAQSHTLQWLLCASHDQNIQDRELKQIEAACAATLMQWLGSPVGSEWLRCATKRADRAK